MARFDGFKFSGSGAADGGSDGFADDNEESEEEDHEHVYSEIANTPNLMAYEEMVHQVVSIEFQDRGITLNFDYEELEELGLLVTEVIQYLQRKRTPDQ